MRPWLAERATVAPHSPALVTAGRRRTFGQLAERADRVARGLAARGVRPGDRVATVLETSGALIEVVHAVQRVGATLVPLNPRLAPAEVTRALAVVRPALVVEDPAALDAAAPASGSALLDVLRPDDPSTIVFTSGTSGVPKGVVLSHANHAASAAGVCARLAVSAADRWLLCMPLCHVGGLAIVLRSARVGFPVVVHPGFDPEAFVREVADERVTIVSVVATMLARVLDIAEAEPGALATLRCVLVGGGPLPATVLARARSAGVPVAQTYGLTEASSMVTSESPGTAGEAGSVGAPIRGVEVRIADADHDGIGEILVRGPIVASGCLDQHGATTPVLREGWLRTGDLGRLAVDGVLHVAGRHTDLVVTGGENVHPTEVEAVLLAHPDVVEAAVYGVPDDAWGERLEAKIVFRREPVASDVLAAWCATQLGRFKIPKIFHAVRSLPRTASGKLERAAL